MNDNDIDNAQEKIYEILFKRRAAFRRHNGQALQESLLDVAYEIACLCNEREGK